VRAWKRRALELADRMLELDPGGAGLSLPQLRKQTGESRAVLEWDLAWLVETGGATVTLDVTKRRLWSAVPDEADQDQPPLMAPPADLIDYSALEDLVSSFE
jgi:hypothetical protein